MLTQVVGLSYAEAADVCSCPVGTVRSRVARARAVVARARQRGCTLVVTQGDWQGASMRMDARVRGYQVTSDPGFGRIGEVQVSVRLR